MRLRALVLAAGRGSRLRPLTDVVPKPLLPVAGRPILSWTLDRLVAIGCEAVAVNLHHEGEQIRRQLGSSYGGVSIHYSEESTLLGTLGALGPLREFLAPADLILIINGDSLCRWPLRRLVRRHLARQAQATLLLARRPDPVLFGGGVGVDGAGDVVSLFAGDEARGEVRRRLVFAGAHVVSPTLLHRVEARPADFISDLYAPLLGEGARLASVATGLRWHDLGTPRRYLTGALDWSRGGWPVRWWRRTWVSRGAVVDRRSRLRSCAVEADARVEGDARLENVVLLPGSRVGRGSVVKDAVLGFGAELPAGSWVERRLVVPRSPESKPGPGDSVVGGMIYKPLAGAPEEGRRGTRAASVGASEEAGQGSSGGGAGGRGSQEAAARAARGAESRERGR